MLFWCILFLGCQPTLIAEFEDKPVVTCYLDAGETPILNIGKLIAFRDDAQYSSQDVNDLAIIITDETAEIDFALINIGEGNYENAALIAQANHTYSLRFDYDGQSIYATTTVPDAPEGVEYSAKSIGVMSPKTRNTPGRGIEVTWSNDDRNFYIVEGSTTSVQPIQYSYDEDEWPVKCFKLDYTQGNTATLSSAQFSYYGYYEISLIRIQTEYVVMSQGSSNTSTSLEDMRGNIDGGYGIFTGINRVRQRVNVYKESSPV